MQFRMFNESKDYLEVKRLCDTDYKLSELPERLGGIGVVACDDNKIVGFAWALSSIDSDIACIEYFVLKKEYRSKAAIAALMMLILFDELERFGVKRVIGMLSNQEIYTKSLVRAFKEVGMIVNDGFLVHGELGTIKSGTKKRYKV